jgi:hypothetical protein
MPTFFPLLLDHPLLHRYLYIKLSFRSIFLLHYLERLKVATLKGISLEFLVLVTHNYCIQLRPKPLFLDLEALSLFLQLLLLCRELFSQQSQLCITKSVLLLLKFALLIEKHKFRFGLLQLNCNLL